MTNKYENAKLLMTMTNKMLKDLIQALNKRVSVLVIVCIILAVLVVGCLGTIIAIVCTYEYEIVYEEAVIEETYTIEQSAEGEEETGGSNYAIVDSEISNKNNDIVGTICGAIIVVAILSLVGVWIYGKTKNNGKAPHYSQKADNSQKAQVVEKDDVENQ